MIDLGLTKIAMIGVVALVVIGPEKLPRVARMAGSLFGRAQRYINDVKQEVSREIDLDEFRKMQAEVRDAAASPVSFQAPPVSPGIAPQAAANPPTRFIKWLKNRKPARRTPLFPTW
jgi:Tat protein translocase TatB subunit